MNVEIIEGDVIVRDGSGNIVFQRPFKMDEVGRLAVFLESAIDVTVKNLAASPVPVSVQGTASVNVANTTAAPAMTRVVNTTAQPIPTTMPAITAAAPLNVTLPLVTAAAPLNVTLPAVTQAAPLPTTVGNTAANPIPMTVTNSQPIGVALQSVANPIPTTVGNTAANPIPMTVVNTELTVKFPSAQAVTLSGNTAANPVFVQTQAPPSIQDIRITGITAQAPLPVNLTFPNVQPVSFPSAQPVTVTFPNVQPVSFPSAQPVTLSGNSAAAPVYVQTPNPQPVSIPGVTAAAPLPVTIPGNTAANPLFISPPNPMPVSIPGVTAAAPLNVTLPGVTAAAPLPSILKNTLADPAFTLVTNTNQYPVVSFIMNPTNYPIPVAFPITPVFSSKENPTYMISTQGVVCGNNKNMLSLHNANNSSVVYAVQSVWVINVQQTAITGVLATFELRRLISATAPTGGTDLSTTGVEAMDISDGVAPLAGLTVRTGGSVTGESTKLLFRGIWSTDEQPAGLFDSANSEPVQQKMNPLWGKRVADCKPLLLRAGQGLTVKCATNTTSGAWDIFAVVTVEG